MDKDKLELDLDSPKVNPGESGSYELHVGESGTSKTPIHRWKLIFKDPGLESLYLESQQKSLHHTARSAFWIQLFLGLYTSFASIYQYHTAFAKTEVTTLWVCLCCLVPVAAVLGLVALHHWERVWKSYGVLEMVVTFSAVLISLWILACNRYRLSGAFGKDPQAVWKQSYFSDSATLLQLDLLVTAVHLFMPLRSCVSWVIPLTGIVGFSALTCALGSPEQTSGVSQAAGLIGMLIVLGAMAWLGRRRLERESRLSFAERDALRVKAQEERNVAISERVMRFNAERELGEAQGTWQPKPPPTAGSAVNQANIVGLQREANQHDGQGSQSSNKESGSAKSRHKESSNPESGGQARTHEGSEIISLTLSSSTSKFDLFNRIQRISVSTQTEALTECHRCMRRPPRPPTQMRCPSPGSITQSSQSSSSPQSRRKRDRDCSSGSGSSKPLSCQSDSCPSSETVGLLPTPSLTVNVCLLHAMRTVCISTRGDKGCCLYHMTLDQLMVCMGELSERKCDDSWCTYQKQCETCGAMARRMSQVCLLCGGGKMRYPTLSL